MRESPCSILVVTATVSGNAARVFEALGAGALDAIDTPNLSDPEGADRLARRILSIARLGGATPSRTTTPGAPAARSVGQPIPTPALIGASTGGPLALSETMKSWPRPIPFAAVVVQHLDPAFVPGLADWLSRETGQRVRVAEAGHAADPGTIWLAGSSRHLLLDARVRFRERDATPRDGHHPSVDALFLSAAEAGLEPCIATLLTGMGSDGAAGMAALRQSGWITIAQDEASSVVWGMPGSAVKCGAASRVLPIGAVGPAIHAHFSEQEGTSR